MRNLLIYFAFIFVVTSCDNKKTTNNDPIDWETPFEKGNGNQTATYHEVISYYEKLANHFYSISIKEYGKTDSGLPLHLISYKSNIQSNKEPVKILVNNGIHPGESDGIDASMMLLRDLANEKLSIEYPIELHVIAVYNVGGSLNRNTSSRTNQNGPESYGFRGNARNYDLNRDFIKTDTRNAVTFQEIYHTVNPDFFIDNHVSNGADYQYVLTHLITQYNRSTSTLANYIENSFRPELEQKLNEENWPITPYVSVWGTTPDKGFSQFLDEPRYSTGYTSLWNTVGLMVETHMLKPYKDRVEGTKILMEKVLEIAQSRATEVKELRKDAFATLKAGDSYALTYKLDRTKNDSIEFLGYEGEYITSKVTGLEQLTYNRNKPFKKMVPYYNTYRGTDSIIIPSYYVIPSGYWNIIEKLDHNQIEYFTLKKDSTIRAQEYRIENYNTARSAYEGHYPHSNVTVSSKEYEVRFRESDIIIPTNQPGIKYLVETLEPQASDSFFKWNYFDTILQQKEGFSSYVFDASAEKLLEQNPSIRMEFDSLKQANPNFKNNAAAQLSWLHKRSPNYEKAHLTYPIYRIL